MASTIPKTVFFDVSAGDKPLGRIHFLLYKNTPRTSLNFGSICQGFTLPTPHTASTNNTTFTDISYKDVVFHRVIKGFMCQVGDVTDAKIDPKTGKYFKGSQPGCGGVSIYGETFKDENFINKVCSIHSSLTIILQLTSCLLSFFSTFQH